MKKLVIAAALALTSFAANALDYSLVTGRMFVRDGVDRNNIGFSIGQRFNQWNIVGRYDYVNLNNNSHANRWSILGGYDLGKVGNLTVTPKLGVSYLDNPAGRVDGLVALYGVGATLPITKEISATADLLRQHNLQNRTEIYKTNFISLGLKYSF